MQKMQNDAKLLRTNSPFLLIFLFGVQKWNKNREIVRLDEFPQSCLINDERVLKKTVTLGHASLNAGSGKVEFGPSIPVDEDNPITDADDDDNYPTPFHQRTMIQNNQESRSKYWAIRSFVRLFARTAPSFRCSALLVGLLCSATLTRSLARSLTPSFKAIIAVFFLKDHSEMLTTFPSIPGRGHVRQPVVPFYIWKDSNTEEWLLLSIQEWFPLAIHHLSKIHKNGPGI